MTHDIGSFFQNVLFVGRLPWVIVVNDIGHSVFISPVRHDLSEPFRALYAQYAAKISEAVQTKQKRLRISSEAFLFKSATTYFHAPFPANYLLHK